MEDQKLFNWIDQIKPRYLDMADEIFDNPELGKQEFKTSKLLIDDLREMGFDVEVGIAGLETAFKATYRRGQGGPNIGFLIEMDALEGIGHACAHHMQGPSILMAMSAIINNFEGDNFQLTVYGTPAEETAHGKIIMLKEGYMKELDVALMMHGSPTTTADVKSMAMTTAFITFHGKASHAAIKPEEGRSALDAMVLSFTGVEFLREHVREDTRMHYSILEGTGAANVVPAKCRAKFYVRSYSREYLNEVEKRFENIIKGAALMTDTTYDFQWGDRLNNKIPVLKLNEVLMEKAEEASAPQISGPRKKTGSTDLSNVMYEIPGSCIRVAFVPVGTASHSQAFIDCGKTKEAHVAIEMGAKVLAASAVKLIEEPNIVAEIKAEFAENKAKLK